MSLDVRDRPGPASRPEPPGKSRFSLEGLQESRPARAGVGLLVVAAALGLIYVIVLAFTGHFTKVVKISTELPDGSNAVPIGAPVQYRNVTVGKVASVGSARGGAVAVSIDIYPSNMAKIPKGVTAQVAPLSIFGNQYVNLVPPVPRSPGHLEAAQSIRPFEGAASTSLQGTVTQIYSLLNAIHPADLDTGLTAFATALNGQGANLGQELRDASSYLGKIAPPPSDRAVGPTPHRPSEQSSGRSHPGSARHPGQLRGDGPDHRRPGGSTALPVVVGHGRLRPAG